MIRTATFAAAALLALAAAQPASAMHIFNGGSWNGLTLQGLSLNGNQRNGMNLQGKTVNGTQPNGMEAAPGAALAATGIRLPNGITLRAE